MAHAGRSCSIGAFGAAITLACLLASLASPALAAGNVIPIDVDNHLTPTTCAEEDNVSATLSGTDVARFTVEALPPAYLASLQGDRTASDFTGCNFNGGVHPADPRFAFRPATRVLFDGAQWRIVGITQSSFWRAQRVPVKLGARTFNGIHLLQIFKKVDGKPREIAVLYPSDGNWRIKPVPEARFGDGAYGSSILIGPIETRQRPMVAISAISVTKLPLALDLKFVGGGAATITLDEVSTLRTSLDVRLTPPPFSKHGRRPFAMLRSMYVAPDNADVSEVTWRAPGDASLRTEALAGVGALRARQVRFGRSVPSRHNSSAPDLRFSDFRD
ncbi:MAG: hypothetical protein JWQ73_2673 [Variovorax sp.]|nr:hypothetical protein [Variovorax sp.]